MITKSNSLKKETWVQSRPCQPSTLISFIQDVHWSSPDNLKPNHVEIPTPIRIPIITHFRLRQTLTTGLQTAQTTGERLSSMKFEEEKRRRKKESSDYLRNCDDKKTSVTRLSPTKGASASEPTEEKVNENIPMNAPTLVPSVRSSLCHDALYCGRQFFHSAQCQSVATFALNRNNIAETHIMHRTYVPRSFGIVFSDQI